MSQCLNNACKFKSRAFVAPNKLHILPLCRFDAGEKPDFLKETKSVRAGSWKVCCETSRLCLCTIIACSIISWTANLCSCSALRVPQQSSAGLVESLTSLLYNMHMKSWLPTRIGAVGGTFAEGPPRPSCGEHWSGRPQNGHQCPELRSVCVHGRLRGLKCTTLVSFSCLAGWHRSVYRQCMCCLLQPWWLEIRCTYPSWPVMLTSTIRLMTVLNEVVVACQQMCSKLRWTVSMASSCSM